MDDLKNQELEENPKSEEIETQNSDFETELKDLKDLLLRQRAETENSRKRHAKEIEDNNKYAVTSFARDMIEILENLNRATESLIEGELTKNLKSFVEGVNLTKTLLLNIFEKHGIKRIYPIDEKFDHNLHQAVMQVEDTNKEINTITQVIQAGYVIKDRLLRPALVAVSK